MWEFKCARVFSISYNHFILFNSDLKRIWVYWKLVSLIPTSHASHSLLKHQAEQVGNFQIDMSKLVSRKKEKKTLQKPKSLNENKIWIIEKIWRRWKSPASSSSSFTYSFVYVVFPFTNRITFINFQFHIDTLNCSHIVRLVCTIVVFPNIHLWFNNTNERAVFFPASQIFDVKCSGCWWRK